MPISRRRSLMALMSRAMEGMMVSAMPVPGMVTVCSPMALNMSSMMRPARSPLDLAQSFTSSIPARFMPAGPPYRSRSASVASRVARSPFRTRSNAG